VENRCAQKVEFAFCYDDKKYFNCQKGDWGADSVGGKARATISGPDPYRGQNVNYRIFGCESPGLPVNIKLSDESISATCQ
jgi:hypothetical protein